MIVSFIHCTSSFLILLIYKMILLYFVSICQYLSSFLYFHIFIFSYFHLFLCQRQLCRLGKCHFPNSIYISYLLNFCQYIYKHFISLLSLSFICKSPFTSIALYRTITVCIWSPLGYIKMKQHTTHLMQ